MHLVLWNLDELINKIMIVRVTGKKYISANSYLTNKKYEKLRDKKSIFPIRLGLALPRTSR